MLGSAGLEETVASLASGGFERKVIPLRFGGHIDSCHFADGSVIPGQGANELLIRIGLRTAELMVEVTDHQGIESFADQVFEERHGVVPSGHTNEMGLTLREAIQVQERGGCEGI